jgi:hypothetical protein
MHALKVTGLLALLLVTMRAGSWCLQWLLFRFAGIRARMGGVVGNLMALVVFAAFVWWNLVPGEAMDMAALVFGIAVFGLFGTVDWFWSPLNRTT